MQDSNFLFIQKIDLLRSHVFWVLVSATWLPPVLKAQKHQSCLWHFLDVSAIVLVFFVLVSTSTEVSEVCPYFSSWAALSISSSLFPPLWSVDHYCMYSMCTSYIAKWFLCIKHKQPSGHNVTEQLEEHDFQMKSNMFQTF